MEGVEVSEGLKSEELVEVEGKRTFDVYDIEVGVEEYVVVDTGQIVVDEEDAETTV
jgi:hypothetical protein